MKKIKKFKDDLSKTDSKRKIKVIKAKSKISIDDHQKWNKNSNHFLNEEE